MKETQLAYGHYSSTKHYGKSTDLQQTNSETFLKFPHSKLMSENVPVCPKEHFRAVLGVSVHDR